VIWIGRWGVARKFTGEVLEEEEGRRCWEMGRRRSSWLKHGSLTSGKQLSEQEFKIGSRLRRGVVRRNWPSSRSSLLLASLITLLQ